MVPSFLILESSICWLFLPIPFFGSIQPLIIGYGFYTVDLPSLFHATCLHHAQCKETPPYTLWTDILISSGLVLGPFWAYEWTKTRNFTFSIPWYMSSSLQVPQAQLWPYAITLAFIIMRLAMSGITWSGPLTYRIFAYIIYNMKNDYWPVKIFERSYLL